MKKITSIILCFVLLLGSIGVVSAFGDRDTLDAVKLLPDFEGGENSIARRDEFSFMVAKLISGEQAPVDTVFSDVDAQNAYSGYIAYLASANIVSGDGEGCFRPSDGVSFYAAAKMLVVALGYEQFAQMAGGYPYGYVEILSMLGVDKGISIDSNGLLTQDGAVKLVQNVLTMKLNSVEYIAGENLKVGMSSDKNEPLLVKNFGISVYEGTVVNVNDEQTSMSVEVTKNKYSSQDTTLTVGAVKEFSVASDLKAGGYLYAPCVLWVNENEEVIKITTQNRVQIKYAVISEINNTKTNYPIANMDSLMLLDDETEYSVSDTAVLQYNGKLTSRGMPLIDKFAKLVIKEDEVLFIESWDLTDGGLITASDGNTLTYIRNGKTAYLRNISFCEKVITIIEGKNANASEIKTDSVFSYYEAEDYLVIVVSEKKIVDVFDGISDNTVKIGGTSYRKGIIYYSENGKDFSTAGYDTLFNRNVQAYVNPNGYVCIITAMHNDDLKVRKIYGFVTGVEMDNMDPDNGKIRIIEAAGDFPEIECRLTKKTSYNDGLSFENLALRANDLKGTGVFVFEISDSGRIISVSEPKPIYGYTATDVSVSSIYDTPLVVLTPDYLYFPYTHPVVVVYEKDGKFTLGWTSWQKLYNFHATTPVKVRFFGDGRDVTPSLIVLASGVGSISELGYIEKYGVIADVSEVLNQNGETACELSVITVNGNKKYTVSKEYATEHSLRKNSVIRFRDGLIYADNDIVLLDDSDKATEEYKKYNCKLEKYSEDWNLPSGWKKAVCEGADSLRLLVYGEQDNAVESVLFHPNQNFIVSYDDSAPINQFKFASWSDIDDGDTVFYNDSWEGTRGVIIIK